MVVHSSGLAKISKNLSRSSILLINKVVLSTLDDYLQIYSYKYKEIYYEN